MDSNRDTAQRIRRLPYPFGKMATFCSDVDDQTPEFGNRLHQYFNETLGLPISDSVWVAGCLPSSSAFFVPAESLNAADSGFDGHTTYAALLRRWHRGDIDHFHGWHDDSCIKLRRDFEAPLDVAEGRINIDFGEDESLAGAGCVYEVVRLFTAQDVQGELTIEVLDHAGITQIAPAYHVAFDGKLHCFEAWFRLPPDGVRVDLGALRSLSVKLPSDFTERCLNIHFVERAAFARALSVHQHATMKTWNIRPALVTDHGGYTMNPGIGGARVRSAIPRTAGSLWADPRTDNAFEPLGAAADSACYILDLLKNLGVIAVWPLTVSPDIEFDNYCSFGSPRPPLFPTKDGIYYLPRSGAFFARTDVASWVDEVLRRLTELSRAEVEEFVCSDASLFSETQGPLLGLLVALSLSERMAQPGSETLWYTHFGTAQRDPDWSDDGKAPLKKSSDEWFARLAQNVYGRIAGASQEHRIWLPPAGSFIRYELARMLVPNIIEIDDERSLISFRRCRDETTGMTFPCIHSGTRDLHGVTIYVRDSDAAQVELDGEPVHTFTRNAPDAAQRPSITIIDNSAPTLLVGGLPLESSGGVEVVGEGALDDIHLPTDYMVARQPERSHFSLKARSSRVVLRFTPHNISAWNTSHLHFVFRKRIWESRQAGRFALKLIMDHGGEIAVSEGAGSEPPLGADAGWWVNPTDSAGWTWLTLDTTQMVWAPDNQSHSYFGGRKAALPIGSIRKIELSLTDVAHGDIFDVRELALLRPNSNGEAADGGKLLSGRVTDRDGQGLANVAVVAAGAADLKTRTNEHGYYFISGVRRGAIFTIHALSGGRKHFPASGEFICVMKNEAEIDIRCV